MGSAHLPGSEVIEALSRGLPGDRLMADPDVLAAISHAGDGNLHPLIISPSGDPAARLAAQASSSSSSTRRSRSAAP